MKIIDDAYVQNSSPPSDAEVEVGVPTPTGKPPEEENVKNVSGNLTSKYEFIRVLTDEEAKAEVEKATGADNEKEEALGEKKAIAGEKEAAEPVAA